MRVHSSFIAALAGACFALAGAAGVLAETPETEGPEVMPGGQEGKVFQDMTVEGEDKIQIEFERPVLDLDLDPKTAPGLDRNDIHDILDNKGLNLETPLVTGSAREHCPFLARPWFQRMTAGPVARFTPQVDGVERWELTVANSRGEAVTGFRGSGKTPKEISWDGRNEHGKLSTPGLTYSYVFEAYDRAGNKRNFMGDGFELPPYRFEDESGLTMLFAADHLETGGPTPTLLLEAATRINRRTVDTPVQIEAQARSYELAKSLADRVMRDLEPLVLGERARIQVLATVQADAPVAGAVRIRAGS